MNKVKRVFVKAGLGIAAGLTGVAALGTSLKKKLSKYNEAEEPNGNAGSTKQDEIQNENKPKQNSYINEGKINQRKMKYSANEEKRKQRECERRIKTLSKTGVLDGSSSITILIVYAIVLILLISMGEAFREELEDTFDDLFITVFIYGIALITYSFMLIRISIYTSKVRTVSQKVTTLQHKLAILREQKERNYVTIYNDINTEIIVHQSALNNIATDFNKFIKKFPNNIYTAIFKITPIIPSEKETIVELKRTSR